MTLARLVAGLLVPAALSIPMLAQAPPATSAGPAFVRLNVLALDDKGQSVGDLKPSDLQVFDQNKPQRVLYFHRKAFALAGKAAPGEFSNRAAAPAHTTVILLDLMNQPRAEALDAAKKVGRSLQQMESGESLYLYALALDGSLVPIHPMPPDPLAPAADDKTWTRQAQAGIDKVVNLVRARPMGMLQEDGVKKTYLAFETLGRQLALYSGERNLVWVMRDVPTVSNPKHPCSGDWLDCALYVQHLTVTLDRTDVPVDPVVYALISSPDTNRGILDISGLLAGRYFLGDDMRSVLANLAGALPGEYVVGYEIPPDAVDNKYHRVKVTCERGGVKITARQRYYAFPDTRPPMGRAQDALGAALKSPFDDPQIGIRATAAPAEKALHLQVQINASDLLLREEGGAFTGHVTVLLAGYGDSGPIGAPVPGDFNLRLSKEQYESAVKDGLPLAQDFPIDSATRKVRLFIYDHATGAVGSLSVPVAAPKS